MNEYIPLGDNSKDVASIPLGYNFIHQNLFNKKTLLKKDEMNMLFFLDVIVSFIYLFPPQILRSYGLDSYVKNSEI